MIATDEQLEQALEQLGRMHCALAALRQEVLPRSERQFALLAEGPLDEIQKLQAAIDAYTGKFELQAADSDLWLRIVGPSLTWPEAPTSVLTALLDALRKGVQAIAEFNTTGHLTARPTKALKDACDLRIVAFQPGSLCVGVRLPERSDDELADEEAEAPARVALEQYLEAAQWVGSDVSAESLERALPDSQARRVILNALNPFVPRPRGAVDRVELSGRAVRRGAPIALTREATRRIGQAIDRIAAEQVEDYVGDLREIDLDSLSFVLRNTGDVREVRCTFEEDLFEITKEALDRRVAVTGVRRVVEGRRVAPTLRVTRLVILDEDVSEHERGAGELVP